MSEIRNSRIDVVENPFQLFRNWYEEHLKTGAGITDAVFLGTVSQQGKVSVRTVLLKDYDETGFIFFTNYNSRKSSDLSSNGNAALLFYWNEKGRQVRIEGKAEKTSSAVSDAYFMTRPRESRLSAWASDQSAEIPGRKTLEDRFSMFKDLYKGNEVPRPGHWGGFRIVPDMFEFWQEGEYRLHDRIVYTPEKGKWIIRRLAP